MSERPQTVPAVLEAAARRFGPEPAVCDGERRVSFTELAELVERSARAALVAGVGSGDRVAIWAPNSLDWIVAALGAVRAGAALVPINTRFKGEEAAVLLRRSRARLAFVSPPFLGTDYPALLDAQRGGLPELTTVVRCDADGLAGWLAGAGVNQPAPVAPDDIGDVLFTSGTTGSPKGVLSTHRQTVRVFQTWADTVGLRRGDRYLVVNPFFHTFGYKAGVLAALLVGATIYPEPVFDAGRVLARVEAERISVLPGPPTLYQSLLDHAERAGRDLSSLRLAVTGAAVVPVRLVERMAAELGFTTVLTAYGLTEATGTVSICHCDDDPVTVASTCGRPLAGTEVRVVAADGMVLPTGQPGEVQVRGYHVMAGYLDDAAASAEAVEPDGWLHTGDVGLLDERGYLRITDRLKDMYVVGGFNAYPAEIEAVLAGCPGVAEVAVVGVADERLGEVGRACVVPVQDGAVTAEALIEWARERLANYKVPREVVLCEQLPRNASGKVVKGRLR